jgi:hypothetical protein
METNKAIKDSWPIIKGNLKFRYPELTNTDLRFEDGNEEELLKIIQTKNR